jgi:Dolichyl-phosphate-mannose-protein mannosyltransferase
MKVKTHLFSIRTNLDSLLAALVGFFIVQIFSKHSGIGVSPDSVTYISAARNLVHGNGFISFENLPVVDFPFGYPLFLSIISFITRLDPIQFGPVLNGFLFGSVLYTSGSVMNGFHGKPSPFYKRILLICILFSPALQEVYSLFWSETIFILLVLLFIISIAKYLEHGTLGWLYLCIIFCSIACLTRYAGVFMIMTGLFLIFFNPSRSWRSRIFHCLIFGGLSFSLVLINIIRNLTVAGFATGMRLKNTTSLLKIFEYFGDVFCDWLMIKRIPVVAALLTISVMTYFIFSMIYLKRKIKSSAQFEYVIALTSLMYCIFMAISSRLTRYELFTNRLLSPMFIPLLWSISWWIPGFISKKSQKIKWVWGISFCAIAVLFLRIEYLADYEYYDGVKDAGVPGYTEDPFVQSDIVQFIEKNKEIFKPALPIYSNAGDAAYFITGLPVLQLPEIAFPSRVQQYYASKNNYLIWFQDLDNPDMPPLDSILNNKNMIVLKQFSDGAVYITK